MLSVVAMAADLKTGVTYKGTWADIENAYTPVEGEIKVTKTDDGLKFEVKNHIFNGYAFPDYTVDYKIDVTEDGRSTTKAASHMLCSATTLLLKAML